MNGLSDMDESALQSRGQQDRSGMAGDVPGEDRLRADLYNFLGLILAAPPNEMLLGQTAGLAGDGSTLGEAVSTLATIARKVTTRGVAEEFQDLFIGVGRGELVPYASFYLTGFLNERPLAALRRDMSASGLGRVDGVFEPEDNIASLMESMGALIVGRFGPPATLDAQKIFFNRHIGPWAPHFYRDLESAKASKFYAAVGTVGRLFMEIEAEGFRMSAA